MIRDLMRSIGELLENSGTVNEAFGGSGTTAGRMYPGYAPERKTSPYLVFSSRSGSVSYMFAQGTNPKPQRMLKPSVQFDIWVDAKTSSGGQRSPDEAYRLGGLVESLINDVPISHPAWGNVAVSQEGTMDVLRDGDFWKAMLIFSFEAHELSPA